MYELFHKKNTARGFTLAESLIVIGILGLFAHIIIGSLNDARAKARDAQRLEDISKIILAIEAYVGDYGTLPGEGDNRGAEISPHCATDIRDDLINGGYFNEVAKDPRADACFVPLGGANYGGDPTADEEFFYGWDSAHCCEGAYCVSINRLETQWAIEQLADRYPDVDGNSGNGVQYVSGGGDANIGTGADFNYCFVDQT